jgi:hypothetical protein
MIIYRVRIVLYDSDENIMWLINTQSALVLTADFLILTVLSQKAFKWNLRYMRYS